MVIVIVTDPSIGSPTVLKDNTFPAHVKVLVKLLDGRELLSLHRHHVESTKLLKMTSN